MEPLVPPTGSAPGDRVFVEGFEHEKLGGILYYNLFLRNAYSAPDDSFTYLCISAPDDLLNPKKKLFEQIQVIIIFFFLLYVYMFVFSCL